MKWLIGFVAASAFALLGSTMPAQAGGGHHHHHHGGHHHGGHGHFGGHGHGHSGFHLHVGLGHSLGYGYHHHHHYPSYGYRYSYGYPSYSYYYSYPRYSYYSYPSYSYYAYPSYGGYSSYYYGYGGCSSPTVIYANAVPRSSAPREAPSQPSAPPRPEPPPPAVPREEQERTEPPPKPRPQSGDEANIGFVAFRPLDPIGVTSSPPSNPVPAANDAALGPRLKPLNARPLVADDDVPWVAGSDP